MRIFLTKKGDLKEELKPCCDEMNKAIDEYAIKFGGFESYEDTRRLGFGRCSPYPEGPCWDTYDISFCPFCGKRVNIVQL